MTEPSPPDIAGTDWLVMCGQNGDTPLLLANGKDVSLNVANGAGGVQLAINKEGSSEWDIVGMSVWNRHLSADEMNKASAVYSGDDAHTS